MSTRVSFTDLLRKGAEKDKQKFDDKNKLSIIGAEESPISPISPTLPTPRTKRTPPMPVLLQPISPEKDFSKVANSIVREAVAQGLFIGKSKQIYDFLYLQTRGAIQPKRSIRITKSNLMRGSDIGSERTLLKNLSHLKSIGLVKVTDFDGQHGGNEYEVFLPEEFNTTHPTPPTAQQAPHPLQKVGTLPPVESGVGGVGQTQENKGTYSIAKTSFKDNTKNDDDARAREGFFVMVERLDAAVRKLTGKSVTKREAESWGTLADLLILELEVAASRTDGVSSIPAFLTEVLRRQFFASHLQQATNAKASITNADTVGKSDSGAYEIKPLDAKGRDEALAQLREFVGDDFLDDFKKWYVEEDWAWLIQELEKQ